MSGRFRKIYLDTISGLSASAIFMAMSGWAWGLAERNTDQAISLLIVAVALALTGFLGMVFSVTVSLDQYSHLAGGKKVFGWCISVLVMFSMMWIIAAMVFQGSNSIGAG